PCSLAEELSTRKTLSVSRLTATVAVRWSRFTTLTTCFQSNRRNGNSFGRTRLRVTRGRTRLTRSAAQFTRKESPHNPLSRTGAYSQTVLGGWTDGRWPDGYTYARECRRQCRD